MFEKIHYIRKRVCSYSEGDRIVMFDSCRYVQRVFSSVFICSGYAFISCRVLAAHLLWSQLCLYVKRLCHAACREPEENHSDRITSLCRCMLEQSMEWWKYRLTGTTVSFVAIKRRRTRGMCAFSFPFKRYKERPRVQQLTVRENCSAHWRLTLYYWELNATQSGLCLCFHRDS